MAKADFDAYMTKARELDAARKRHDEKAVDEITHALMHLWWDLTDAEQERVAQERG